MSPLFSVVLALSFSATPDDGLKTTAGTVASADPVSGKAVIRTPAGLVTFITTGARGLELLEPGRPVELTFFVNEGARLTQVAPALPSASLATPPEPLPMTAANLKSTAGTLATVEADGARLTVLATSGLVTFHATRELTTGLAIGREVRVWYFVSNGAVANKIDLLGQQPKAQKALSQLTRD